MRFYTKQHQFYCGIDLHVDAMYVCILNSVGEVVVHKNISTKPKSFLRLIKPYRERLVVGCECMFSWYWLADLCADENIEGGVQLGNLSVVNESKNLWGLNQTLFLSRHPPSTSCF